MVTALLTLAAILLPATAGAASPTLTLTKLCDDYPAESGIVIHAEGLDPQTPLAFTLSRLDDGSTTGPLRIGPVQFYTDEFGAFDWGWIDSAPATYTVTIEQAGTKLEETLHPDCAPEPEVPLRKSDCKNGGWRAYVRDDGSRRFRNQGRCVAAVVTSAGR